MSVKNKHNTKLTQSCLMNERFQSSKYILSFNQNNHKLTIKENKYVTLQGHTQNSLHTVTGTFFILGTGSKS